MAKKKKAMIDRKKLYFGWMKIKKNFKKEEKQELVQDAPVTVDVKTIAELPKQECTGCAACSAACPHHAITMKEDEEGFYSPVLDADACKNCRRCTEVCPQIHPKERPAVSDKYIAVQAEGENRKKSTAGGFFITLAKQFMEDGGYVCAAVTAIKGKRTKHYVSNDPKFAVRYGKAKYMQSDLGNCLSQMQDLLKKGKKVLFAGCPCQVAGVKSLLAEYEENLLTVDVACHGVASPGSFDKYCLETFGGEPRWIDFHCKMIYGSYGSGMRLMRPDGTEYVAGAARDPFFRSYHAGLNVRKSCGFCKYQTEERVGDITLGTLYNSERINKDWEKGLSLSLIQLNTQKADAYVQSVKKQLQVCESVSVKKVKELSPIVNRPYYDDRNRDRFFELLRQTYFLKALNYAQQGRYDIAVLGLWFGRNYGSMITYYALHQVLKGMGLSVLMIANPLQPDDEDVSGKTHPVRFAMENYHISHKFALPDMWRLNAQADAFIVGSDQLWNYWLSRPYGQAYYLEFVDDYNKKIAYGTSFGARKYNGPEGQRLIAKSNLKKFDAVSVREEYAIETCKESFDVDAVKVLDPVFLCDRKEYHNLAEKVGMLEEEPFILAYILNPDEKVGRTLTELSESKNCNVRIILDEPPWLFADNKSALKIKESKRIKVLRNIEVKEWLYYFKNAEYVVTDSFHGTCFSIIFERRFMTMVNKKRARDRFPALMEPLGLMNHLVEEPEMVLEDGKLDQIIDYQEIFRRIEDEKVTSMKWLKDAIFSRKTVDMDKAYERVEKARKVENNYE